MRIIKRYKNRKMYDTYESCYITLEEVGELVKAQQDFRVIDAPTKNDITWKTLLTVIQYKDNLIDHPISTDMLKRVIAKGDGTFINYVSSTLEEIVQS